MRYRVVYHIMFFALVLYFWTPSLVHAGMAGGEGSAILQENSPRRLPMAQESIGFRVVGTVVADDPAMSVAVIEIPTTGEQRVYPEGKWFGEVQIKKILHNHVIIDAGRGDQILRMHAQASASQPAPQQQQPVRSGYGAGRNRTIRLSREEVESSLQDVEQLMQNAGLSPYAVYGRVSGMMFTSIPPGSILSKMGLASGNVIIGLDDEATTSPEQVTAFFQRLKQGGDFSLKVRNRGVRRRTRLIHLKIE